MQRLTILSIALVFIPISTLIAGGRNPEEEAVYKAVQDYVEGVYLGQPERIERSVHSQMRKHGFYLTEAGYRNIPMTFDQLVKLAATWKKAGNIPADATYEITLFEVSDQTATAKLTAFWGMDYFHLAKFDGKWQISNVIWQSIPDKKT